MSYHGARAEDATAPSVFCDVKADLDESTGVACLAEILG